MHKNVGITLVEKCRQYTLHRCQKSFDVGSILYIVAQKCRQYTLHEPRSQAHYPSREDCLHAVSHPRHHPPDLHIFLNNHAITQVYQHKHFGVILSSTLSWSPHVDHLNSHSSAMLGLLRHLHSYFHFSSRCLLKVYLCFIRPLLEYGCTSFAGLSVRSACQLEAVQQKALSICSVDSACIPSLSERRSSILLRLFFSILDDNVPDHLSGFCRWPFVHTATTRTLRNSSAIRLPRPRTSLFLSSPLYRYLASAYNSSVRSIWAEFLIIFTPSFYIPNLF